MTFAEKFCRARHVAPEDYDKQVLRLSLYPMARILRPLLAANPDYFSPDRELIRGVGRISRLRDFEELAMDFSSDAANRRFSRRLLRLRVSARRLRTLVRSTLHDGGEAPADAAARESSGV
jgi:hypothetical protein